MYKIHIGGSKEQVIITGMTPEEWECLRRFISIQDNLDDGGGILYSSYFETTEMTADCLTSTESDSELNIELGFCHYTPEEQDEYYELVVNLKFFEYYMMHWCRGVFDWDDFDAKKWFKENYPYTTTEYHLQTGQSEEKHYDDSEEQFTLWNKITNEISKAWPYPHIDWW